MEESNETPEETPVTPPAPAPTDTEGVLRKPKRDLFPQDILDFYTVYDYRHAAAILVTEFKSEFDEICHTLRAFRFTDEQVKASGGNESAIPKTFSSILEPVKWKERKLSAKLVVD